MENILVPSSLLNTSQGRAQARDQENPEEGDTGPAHSLMEEIQVIPSRNPSLVGKHSPCLLSLNEET